MIRIRKAIDRGHADHGWLDAWHTFSFAGYMDPEWMGYSALRVLNQDRIQPGAGFPPHPHDNMEIVTVVLEGSLQHKDSMGNGSVIRPSELQRMTAGTGVLHSEFNASDTERAHLLQIWILPERNGLEPGYEQKLFPVEEKLNQWRLVGSRDGRDGSLTVHQDIELWSTVLDAGASIDYAFHGRRRGFMQVVRGTVEIDEKALEAGDAVAIVDQQSLRFEATSDSELLLFDMA
jgi:redox-sensitive bicupin YhaK (pirin superfamily)